ncbi:MAG: hypothetical protein AB7O31_00235 [Burkholderiales bacterium]
MLSEHKNVRQVPGEPKRRWFSSESEDLIIWYAEDETIVGFQLCYDREIGEKALSWWSSTGYTHNRIDDGDATVGRKRLPVLRPDGVFDASAMQRRFSEIAADLPPEIASFVQRSLEQYGSHESKV